MRINTNISALNAHRQLGVNQWRTAGSLERLSSGLRINRAGDDAAGLAISEKMRGQVRGLNQASRNAQDGISLIQTAEGALNETHAILQRMRELAVQASNDTLVTGDRDALQSEATQLQLEIDRISGNTQFNELNLLDGSVATTAQLEFQVGANQGQVINLTIATMGAATIGAGTGTAAGVVVGTGAVTTNTGGVNLTTHTNATISITNVEAAITEVSKERSGLGAVQNRLTHTIRNLDTSAENLQAAESRIRDVDMAAEMMEFTKLSILNQAATAMLAQANMAPQLVLQLLG